MSDWRADKSWADVYMPQVKAHLGPLFIGEATEKEDREQATDLKTLVVKETSIGVRIRDAAELMHQEYRYDVTFRLSRPSGQPTEVHKIADGWVDFYYYGFGCRDSGLVVAYRVLNVELFRRQMVTQVPPVKWRDVSNRDGSSRFRAVDSRSFGKGVIVKSWVDAEMAQQVRRGKISAVGA